MAGLGCFMLKSGFFSKSLVLCLIKNPKNRLSPIFSPDFTLNGQIGLFYAEKWIFLKKLGTLLKRKIEDFLFCEDKNN